MVRQYIQVTDDQRNRLVQLIHKEKYSIAKASKVTKIPYDNAKAINRTYMKEERVKKINYSQRYQTRKKNYGRKRNQPVAKDKKVNEEEHDFDSENKSDDDLYEPNDCRALRSRRSNVSKSENDLKPQNPKSNQEQIRHMQTTTSLSNSSKKTKRSELDNLQKQNQFMREMGLQDIDMKQLDEENGEEDEEQSPNYPQNLLRDSHFETRSQQIPIKYGLNQNKQQTNSLQKKEDQAQKKLNIFQNTGHDQSSYKFKQGIIPQECLQLHASNSSKMSKLKKIDQTPTFKCESINIQNQPRDYYKNNTNIVKSISSNIGSDSKEKLKSEQTSNVPEFKDFKAPHRTASESFYQKANINMLPLHSDMSESDVCRSLHNKNKDSLQQSSDFDQIVMKLKQKLHKEKHMSLEEQVLTSEKELIKRLDEFAHPSMNFQMPNCMNGIQRFQDTHSLDNVNIKLFPSSVLNQKMLLTPDSLRPMKSNPVQCDINRIIDKIKKGKGSEKDSPASTETFKTSLSGINVQKSNSPNLNEGACFQPLEVLKKNLNSGDSFQQSQPIKISSPKPFYPSSSIINQELQNIKILKKPQIVPINRELQYQRLVGKFQQLKATTSRATQVLVNKNNPNSKFMIVSAEGISNLIRNQQMLIDLIQESLNTK